MIEEELGCSVDELFTESDPEPLAAASIGQVHAATLTGGTRVVVKAQRPGVAGQVEGDLALLLQFATSAAHRTSLAEQCDLVALAKRDRLDRRASGSGGRVIHERRGDRGGRGLDGDRTCVITR